MEIQAIQALTNNIKRTLMIANNYIVFIWLQVFSMPFNHFYAHYAE